MEYLDILKEIERVESALLNTKSSHLKRDYGKYLYRLKCKRNNLEREIYGK